MIVESWGESSRRLRRATDCKLTVIIIKPGNSQHAQWKVNDGRVRERISPVNAIPFLCMPHANIQHGLESKCHFHGHMEVATEKRAWWFTRGDETEKKKSSREYAIGSEIDIGAHWKTEAEHFPCFRFSSRRVYRISFLPTQKIKKTQKCFLVFVLCS